MTGLKLFEVEDTEARRRRLGGLLVMESQLKPIRGNDGGRKYLCPKRAFEKSALLLDKGEW